MRWNDYAAGVLTYMLLTGKAPFDGQDDYEVLHIMHYIHYKEILHYKDYTCCTLCTIKTLH
jgi:hypothetical protein